MGSGRIWYSGQTKAPLIALTFDDGPDPRYTPAILNILRAYHIPATFFVRGDMLRAYPDLGRRIVMEGHIIGNHTETHSHIEKEHNPDVFRELTQCEHDIEKITGVRSYLFRPPRGWWNATVFQDALHENYYIILWNLALEHHTAHNPNDLCRRVIRLARPGDIILLHDGFAGKSDARRATVLALEPLILGLRQRGYTFTTIPELLHIVGNEHVSLPKASARQFMLKESVQSIVGSPYPERRFLESRNGYRPHPAIGGDPMLSTWHSPAGSG
jgi:peptidoglycan/xylan/chitin deacetylase (PgdA/CDA1 family)